MANSVLDSLEHIARSFLQALNRPRSYTLWLDRVEGGEGIQERTEEEVRQYTYYNLNVAITLLVRLARHPEGVEELSDAMQEFEGWMGERGYGFYWRKLLEKSNELFPEADGYKVLKTK